MKRHCNMKVEKYNSFLHAAIKKEIKKEKVNLLWWMFERNRYYNSPVDRYLTFQHSRKKNTRLSCSNKKQTNPEYLTALMEKSTSLYFKRKDVAFRMTTADMWTRRRDKTQQREQENDQDIEYGLENVPLHQRWWMVCSAWLDRHERLYIDVTKTPWII